MSRQPAAYTPTAMVLHWLTAALVIPLIVVGIVMGNLPPGALGDLMYDLHRSTGAVLLIVVLVRIAWRLGHAPPPLPAGVPLAQQRIAGAVHMLLYTLLLVQPVVGWAATSAYPAPIVVFGLFELPPIWPANRAASEWLFGVHRALGILMALLVLAHAGAALHHHFVRRDGILRRMTGIRG